MTPKPHANPEIAALEAQWWKDWWAADYSWDGLKAKEGPEGTANMQVFWHSEEARLIPEPGTSRRWTRLHCPFVFADGTPSPKMQWRDAAWQDLCSDVLKPRPEGNHSLIAIAGGVFSDVLIADWPSDALRSILAAQIYIGGNFQTHLTKPLFLFDMAGAWVNACRLAEAPFTLRADAIRAENTIFAGGYSSRGVVFNAALFQGARFCGDADFREVHFQGLSLFGGTRFANKANFSESVFSDHADFTAAHFAGPVDFFGCRFQGRAIFDKTQCLDDIGFYKSAFVRRLTLNDARLYGRLNLEGATDGDPIAQSSQAIRLTASGEPVNGLTGTLEPTSGPPERSFKSLPKLHARRTQFFEDANFSNRDLLSPSTFRDAVFHERAQFHGSDIHANVNLYGTNFRRALAYRAGSLPRYPEDLLKLRFLAEPDGANYATWKKTYLRTRIERRFDNFTADNYYNNLEASFRTLKQMMEERRDRLKEGEFFNLELRARRKRSDIPLWERITSYLYWLVSDYGNSLFRPMVMLLLLFGAMATVYYTIGQMRAHQPVIPMDGHGLYSALVFSLQNVFAPFSVLDASKFNANDAWIRTVVLPADPAQSLIIKLLASTQSLLSLTLAFLAGLAGRRRFQIN